MFDFVTGSIVQTPELFEEMIIDIEKDLSNIAQAIEAETPSVLRQIERELSSGAQEIQSGLDAAIQDVELGLNTAVEDVGRGVNEVFSEIDDFASGFEQQVQNKVEDTIDGLISAPQNLADALGINF